MSLTEEDKVVIAEIAKEAVDEAIGRISTLHQSQIPPQTIKRRHLEDKVIVFGLAADRPTNSDTGIFCWFSTDNDTLALYNGSAWVEEIFT